MTDTEVGVVESQEADKDELTAALEDSDEGEKVKETEEETEEEVKKEEDEKVEEEKQEEEEQDDEEILLLRNELKDLRQMLRTSKREQAQQQAKIDRVAKRSVSKEKKIDVLYEDEDEGEEDKEEEDPEALSKLEGLQASMGEIASERGASLDILLETMEQSAGYNDIRSVCSRTNFDDIFELISQEMVSDSNGKRDLNETLLEVELSVWNKANPYKYMYNIIKTYHPSYTVKEVAKEEKKEKTLPKAPGTIADKGGSTNTKVGWTSKRIDDMPEDELDDVPAEIYKKYMQGDLD